MLLDQGLPRSASSLLSASGHDAVHVGECGLSDATDGAIIAHAVSERRLIVTLDADFHALIAVSGRNAPSVIRIRVEGLRAEPLSALLVDVISRYHAESEQGALVTIQHRRVRLRRLPI